MRGAGVSGPHAERPPYRPYLAGPPRFRVGLRRLDPARWLRPDPELEAGRAHGTAMLDARFQAVFRAMPGSPAAQAEARALVEAALGEDAPETGEPELARARRLVSDDLVVMAKDGADWRAAALALCQPTFFSAGHAIGKSLDALHGPVPGGSPKLAGAVSQIFDRLPAVAVFERFNWTIQCGEERYAPDGEPLRARAARLGADAAAQRLCLRVERQTIRRLPETGGVLFTIRVAIDPLTAALADADGARAIATAWRQAPGEARGYKRWAALDPAMRLLLGKAAG